MDDDWRMRWTIDTLAGYPIVMEKIESRISAREEAIEKLRRRLHNIHIQQGILTKAEDDLTRDIEAKERDLQKMRDAVKDKLSAGEELGILQAEVLTRYNSFPQWYPGRPESEDPEKDEEIIRKRARVAYLRGLVDGDETEKLVNRIYFGKA